MSILDDIGNRFSSCYTIESELKLQLEHEADFAQKRLSYSKILYFKLLEAVVNDEMKRNPNYNIAVSLILVLLHSRTFKLRLQITNNIRWSKT